MFTWRDKHYLGAAHGMAGILYILMQVGGYDDITLVAQDSSARVC